VRYGNSVSFSGKQVDVPIRWTGTADYTKVTLIKFPSTLLSGTSPVGGVIISKLLGQRAGESDTQVVENWYRVHSALTSGTNLVMSSVNEANLTCIQISAKQSPDRVDFSCLAYPSMLTAEFIGPAKDIPEVLRIVRTLR
jgi:hypothetical protein